MAGRLDAVDSIPNDLGFILKATVEPSKNFKYDSDIIVCALKKNIDCNSVCL